MHALVLAALTEGSRGHQVAGCRVRFPRHLGQRMAPGVIKATVHPGEQLPKTQRYRRWIFEVEGERPAWTCDVGLRAANGTYAYNGGVAHRRVRAVTLENPARDRLLSFHVRECRRAPAGRLSR